MPGTGRAHPPGEFRVLVLASGFPYHEHDGRYTFIADHCHALARLGVPADVISFDSDPGQPTTAAYPGGSIWRLPRLRLKTHARQVLVPTSAAPVGVDLASYTHVAAHALVGLPLLRLAKSASAGRVRTAYVMHGIPAATPIRAAFWRFLVSRDRDSVDQIFVVGPALLTPARRFFPRVEPHLLPNGAQLAQAVVPARPAGAEGPRFDGFRACSGLRVATVARLEERKGVDILLRSIGRLMKGRHPDLFLAIVGQGPDQPELEQLAVALGIRDNVVFMGGLGRNEVAYVLNQADVFVLASRREPYGVAAAEAALAGCAVLASDQVGAAAFLASRGGWLIHRAGSVEELSSQLEWCTEHPQRVRALGAKARDAAGVEASWEGNARTFITRVTQPL
jgi:glycosyltransferase involved in cell wall biosynthesis